jgi:hypothetical protein
VSKKRRGRASKYTDAFKRQLVAESNISGATVPMVSKQHGVPTSRIYSWRGDVRFQPSEVETPGFVAIEVSDAPKFNDIVHHSTKKSALVSARPGDICANRILDIPPVPS